MKYITVEKNLGDGHDRSAKEPAPEVGDMDWSHKKVIISFTPGFYLDLLNIKTHGIGMQGMVGLKASFFTPSHLYFGIGFNFAEIWSAGSAFGKIPVIDGLAFIGYLIPVNRWLFTVDVGAGYFLIPLQTLMYNPVFGFNLGARYLVSEKFSLGLDLNSHMYYNGATSLLYGGLALMFSYVL